jgi:exodeoxyribonuclease V beta subunit
VNGEEQDPRADRPRLLDGLRKEDGTRPHAVIEASAGTGKTHTLEHLVIDLLLEGTPIDRVLVVTFTEKATLEMRSRIRARIARLVQAGHKALAPALLDFDRAPISTIHGFCQRVLAEQAFVSGRLLEQQRLDSREAFARTFRSAIRQGLFERAPERRLIEAALASMGALRLEETLWTWSKERGEIRPRFDAEALTNAVIAMPSRSDLEGAPGRAIMASIPHHAVRMRVREILNELAPLSELLAAGEPIDAVLPDLFALGQASPHRAAERNIDYLATQLASHETLAVHARVLQNHLSSVLPALMGRVLPSLVSKLEIDKRQKGRFDFDDMLFLVHEAIHGAPGEAALTALRARYKYALVDEFQDTDPIQWGIFRKIFMERTDGGALVLIGDPKQSIYAFRSADVHTYLAACDEVVHGGGLRIPLVDCFRSTPMMIDAINLILKEGFFTGPNRYPNPVRAGREDLRAVRSNGDAIVPIELLHLVSKDKLRAKPMRFALANAIADEIAKIAREGFWVSDRKGAGSLRPANFSDIFVLTRTGKEAREVAEALSRRGIPHALSAEEKLFETREARDVLDVLRALETPGSRSLRLRAWLTRFFAAMPEDLDACRALPSDHAFAMRLSRWGELAREERFAALFHAMMDESGLSRRLLFLREGERELVNYQHILEILLARGSKGRLTLRELVHELSQLIDQGGSASGSEDELPRLESDRAAVQLLTMHKSKGLEAEVVFLFGGMTSRISSAYAPHVFHEDRKRVAWIGPPSDELKERIQDEEREEYERLLYVAMTRARSRLYLPYIGPAPKGAPLPAGHVSEFARMSGAYRILADRLVSLTHAGYPAHWIERRIVPVTGARRRVAAPTPLAQSEPLLAKARALVRELANPEQFAELRGASRGIEITSYTRMKAGRARMQANVASIDDPGTWRDEFASEPSAQTFLEDEDELPGGAAFGVFVHEVLEHIDFESVPTESASMLAEPKRRELFEKSAERNGIDPRFIEKSASLVWRTLRTPIRAGALVLPEGFAEIRRKVAEMSFLHPIPERAHPAFGDWHGPDRAPLIIERGFVRGVIDLLFEHEGRMYVLDWKTDRLPSYNASTLEAHIDAHYEIQARLYALGVARMLRIDSPAAHEARFGGILYCFVRGMRARARSTEGVTLARPSFAKLAEWDRALREEDAPFGHPLPARPLPPPAPSSFASSKDGGAS